MGILFNQNFTSNGDVKLKEKVPVGDDDNVRQEEEEGDLVW